jgi:hypothetical protein
VKDADKHIIKNIKDKNRLFSQSTCQVNILSFFLLFYSKIKLVLAARLTALILGL